MPTRVSHQKKDLRYSYYCPPRLGLNIICNVCEAAKQGFLGVISFANLFPWKYIRCITCQNHESQLHSSHPNHLLVQYAIHTNHESWVRTRQIWSPHTLLHVDDYHYCICRKAEWITPIHRFLRIKNIFAEDLFMDVHQRLRERICSFHILLHKWGMTMISIAW